MASANGTGNVKASNCNTAAATVATEAEFRQQLKLCCHCPRAACSLQLAAARFYFRQAAVATATAGNDNFNFRFRLVQLLTLNMVSICSRTPSALRHSKRSNILAKDVNRNIQKLSRRTKREREREGDKNDRQSKVFCQSNSNNNNHYANLAIFRCTSSQLSAGICIAETPPAMPVQMPSRLAHWHTGADSWQ